MKSKFFPLLHHHTFYIFKMSFFWPPYFYPHNFLYILFLLVLQSAALPWSVHCSHASSFSPIYQSVTPFYRSTQFHHNRVQPLWPLALSHRGMHNSLTLNSSHAKNNKRFSTDKKSKHNNSRHQSRSRKMKTKTSISSSGPSWAQSGAGQHSGNISLLLDQLLLGYERDVRPNFGGPPLEVQVDMHIRSMGPISEVDMTYVIDCYFRQSWKDSRLAYKSMPNFQNFNNSQNDLNNEKKASSAQNTSQNALALSIYMLEKIWRPSTYFHNSRQSHIHMITLPNKFVRIYENGQVLFSSRMTIKANCEMKLERFPMDTQRCPLTLGSFGYTSKDLIYKWNPTRKVVINPELKMSQFDVVGVPVSSYNISMQTSSKQLNYSVLVATFHFKRHSAAFVIEVYLVCFMLTVLSWVGFWINREATADRVTLGLTNFLTMTFLGLELRNDLPKVPYLTALDYFVYISFAFISATILEFGFVHFFTKIGSGEYYFMPIQELSRNEYQNRNSSQRRAVLPKRVDGSTMSRSVDQIVSSWSPVEVKRSASWSISPKIDEAEEDDDEILYTRPPSNSTHTEYRQIGADNVYYNSNRINSFRNSLRNRFRHSFRQRGDTHRRSVMSANEPTNVCKRDTSIRVQLNSVSQIDRVSRLVFPVAYLLMNFVYWYIYLTAERNLEVSHPFKVVI